MIAPARVVVAPGTALRWTNGGRNRHTVTAADGSFDSGALAFGASFAITAPAGAGTIDYACDFHAFMRGSITVSDLTLDGPAAVPAGRAAALRGAVPGAPAGTEVVIERRVPGAWRPVARAATGDDGAYAAAVGPLRARAVLRAVAGERVSPALRVAVTPRLAVRRAGARVTLAAGRPSAGAAVRLERLDLDSYRWRVRSRHRLSPAGVLTVVLGAPGVYRFAVAPAGALAGATSAPVVNRPYRLRVP